MSSTARSPEAEAYRRMYWTAEWRALKKAQLLAEPWCRRVIHGQVLVPATVANHKQPHRGCRKLFFDPLNLESVCKPCHDGPIQSEERRGFSKAVDASGWPTDPRHRANRTRP
jgi:hypothetical protein